MSDGKKVIANPQMKVTVTLPHYIAMQIPDKVRTATKALESITETPGFPEDMIKNLSAAMRASFEVVQHAYIKAGLSAACCRDYDGSLPDEKLFNDLRREGGLPYWPKSEW